MNTLTEMLEKLKSLCGGSFYPSTAKRPEHHKKQWIWQISRRENVLSILKSVYPYLTTKREVADKAIAYVSS